MTLLRLKPSNTLSSVPETGSNEITNLYWDPVTSKLMGQYMGENMAIQNFSLDPNAQAYTDDQIVGKVNTATANITRASSVDAAARPIAAGEVDSTELAAGAVTNTELDGNAAKDNLDALADTARGYIQTNGASGEFPVIAIQRDASGNLDVDYDDVAIV